MNDDLSYDLTFTKRSACRYSGGTWIAGSLSGYRFQALVFPEHAENSEYEIGDSQISKLWIQRITDRSVTYNWDRGLDLPAADATTNLIVEFLCAGLAEHAFA
jgi:hypothetical protein